ncbi:MAG: hypothetical protein QM699_19210 [Amaricoccus sp.]|uniref:hypothetical protein n=1 Tax=Amaricoccus sp. TaxID=1872485 RepID=UPI0039E22435
MRSFLLSGAAAALLGLSITSVAFAQQASRQGETPYPAIGAAPACTQLELANGIHGADCGKMSLTEVAKKKFSHDNT